MRPRTTRVYEHGRYRCAMVTNTGVRSWYTLKVGTPPRILVSKTLQRPAPLVSDAVLCQGSDAYYKFVNFVFERLPVPRSTIIHSSTPNSLIPPVPINSVRRSY